MQQRRGLRADLPLSLAEGEFGWCLDTQQLFIGNGPGYGANTEILTQHSPNDTIITNRFKTYSTTIESAIVRPLGSKLNDSTSVKDFGAQGDGVTDDTSAINDAIAELLYNPGTVTDAEIAQRVVLRLPAGVYVISSSILLYPYLTLLGDGLDKTIILAQNSYSDTCMIQTADSEGNTTSNIGLGTGFLPSKIVVANLTFSTNSQTVDVADLVRYQGIRFENVKFIGNGSANPHNAVLLRSIGTGTDTYDAQFVRCEFIDFDCGIYADDPVMFTSILGCTLEDLNTGISIGLSAVGNGPKWTMVSNSKFSQIYSYALAVYSSNPGVTSTTNWYIDCGTGASVSPIYWDTGTSLNTSASDIFNNLPGVVDNGTTNLIANAQQSYVPLQVSLYTTVARNLLSPTNGYLIYNTTDNRFQGYQNGAWINLDDGSPA
jgi:hypothetical protein